MAGETEDTRVFRPSADVLVRKVDDDFVLVHMGRNQIFALNRTGARLWELLSEGQRQRSAIDELCREFDVDAATVELETQNLLEQLLREGLLEPAAS